MATKPVDRGDNSQCANYAKFMHTLERPAAEALYWTFFTVVLLFLFAASWRYGRVMERVEHMRQGDWERQHLIYRCFYVSIAFGVVGLSITILEAFVLLALQFCDQEPLSSLYWSTWTVLQVGAVVAMFGITLHVRHMIKGRRHPPWALALGTPVLVVAGLGHYFQGKLKKKANDIKSNMSTRSISRSRETRGRRSVDGPLSEVPTVRDDSPNSMQRTPQAETDDDTRTVFGGSLDKVSAKIIGFTKEGDVILRIPPELSEDLNTRVKTQSSITWDEPRRKMSVSTPVEELGRRDTRGGRPIHRSTSSVTFKGKEKEPVIIRTNNGDFRDRSGATDEQEYAPVWNIDVEKSVFNPLRQTRLEELRGWRPEASGAASPKSGGPGGDEKA